MGSFSLIRRRDWRKLLLCILVVCVGVLLTGCSKEGENEDNRAILSVEAFGSNAFVKLHASDTQAGQGQSILSTSYTVAELTENTASMTPFHHIEGVPHTEHHLVALSPGEYEIRLTVDFGAAVLESANSERIESSTTETLIASEIIVVNEDDGYAILEIDADPNCQVYCANHLDNDSDDVNKTFCYTDFTENECSSTALNIENLLTTAKDTGFDTDGVEDDDLLVCLRAIGAPGTSGSGYDYDGNSREGGDFGYGGMAQTVMTYSELLAASDEVDDNHYLYLLVGEEGASSMVFTADFTDATSWTYADIALIGGGGGSGGDGLYTSSKSITNYDGGDGGQGGVVSVYSYAYYTDDPDSTDYDFCAFAAGEDGVHSYVQADFDYIYGTGYPFESGGSGGGSDYATLVDCSDEDTVNSDYAVGGKTDFVHAEYLVTNHGLTNGRNDGSSGLGGLINYSPYATTADTESYTDWINDSELSGSYYDNFDATYALEDENGDATAAQSYPHSGSGSFGYAEYSAYAGNGGAGAGGGAGGAYSSGGGGGGSMARSYLSDASSSAATDWCEQDSTYSTQGSSVGGMVQVIFYNGKS
ncbi:hypothetical protein [uncultured Shewanella sp.]|uniref:hypothetical protein n=1 Tax=uncultured Shewanella sp. TaxID=173975 RepID=UPI0026276A74|nr:hypothetical protein [uncultured Shewanella sp.]